MCVSFKLLRAIKIAVPVPQFDGHVVRRGQQVGQIGMHFKAPNVVGMTFKFLDFFHGIVVKNANAHVIGCRYEPLLAGHEFGASHGKFRDFK
jgi:hypothetical protein